MIGSFSCSGVIQKTLDAEMVDKTDESSFLTLVIENISEGLCICHNTDEFPYVKFTVWNRRMTEITGYTVDEINLSGWYQKVYPDPGIQEKAIKRMEEMRHGNDLRGEEWEITTSDGNKKWLSISTSIVKDENDFVHVLAIMSDITDRKQTEEKLQKAREELEERIKIRTFELQQTNEKLKQEIKERMQLELERQKIETKALAHAKLASLGEIATGIAHEIYQPLSYIKVIYQAVIEDLHKGHLNPEEMQEEFSEALRQVDRISRIIEHLRTFGRSDSKVFHNVDLKSVLYNALILMGEKLRLENIILNQFISDDLENIHGNASQLEQIFINLIQNSLDALKDREDGIINVQINNEKDKVVILFSDNGPGIPEGILDRIFEPFYSTKKIGQGVGLGLSIVYGIVEDHNGTISCESEAEQGATFVISFPQSKDQKKSH